MSKPQTFQELETNAHDIQVTIDNQRDNFFSMAK